MPITVVGFVTSDTSGTTATIDAPPGVQADDFIIWAQSNQNAGAIPPAEGFTAIGSGQGTALGALTSYKWAGAAEPSSYSNTAMPSGKSAGILIVLRGVDKTNTFAGSSPAPTTNFTAGAEAISLPTISSLSQGHDVFAIPHACTASGVGAVDYTSTNADSIVAEVSTNAGGANVAVAILRKTITTAGSFQSFSPSVATTPNPNRHVGITFALRPAPVQAGTTFQAGGTVAATSSVSGSATVRTPAILAAGGTVAGTSSVSGATTLRAGAGGTVAGSSTAAGSALRRAPAGGTVAASSSLSGGTPTLRSPAGGTVAAVSAVSGSASIVGAPVAHQAGGTVAAVSTTSGSASLVEAPKHPAAGAVAAVSGVTGAATARRPAGGTVAGSSGSSGAVALRGAVGGTVAAQAAVLSFTPTQQAAAGGTAAAASNVTGSATVRSPAILTAGGTVVAVSTVEGQARIYVEGPQNRPAGGTVAATSTTTGAATVRRAAGGTVAAVTGARGDMTARRVTIAPPVEAVTAQLGDMTARLVADLEPVLAAGGVVGDLAARLAAAGEPVHALAGVSGAAFVEGVEVPPIYGAMTARLATSGPRPRLSREAVEVRLRVGSTPGVHADLSAEVRGRPT